MPLPPPVTTTLRPEKSKRSFTAIAFAFILFSVTLRCERSEPRRATARAVHPSRAATRPPQDDGPRSLLRLFGIHQHEDDAAGLGAVIEPGMVGGLLNDDVAGFDVDGLVVEHHVDL